jgi:hypothetical protein
MARKKLIHALPPLTASPAIKATHHKEARLLEIMRGIAINNQLDEPAGILSNERGGCPVSRAGISGRAGLREAGRRGNPKQRAWFENAAART